MTKPRARRPRATEPDQFGLGELPVWVALTVSLALTVVAGGLDWATGAEIAFSVFYLPAVALAAWNGGRERGMVVAAVAAAVWYAADQRAGGTYSGEFIPLWNTGVRLAIFVLFAVIVAAWRSAADRAAALGDVDPSTGFTPPDAFYPRVELEYASTARGGPSFTLVYIDLGGAAGGTLDSGVAERATTALRRVLRGHDMVARPRERELAVFLPDTPADAVPAILERLGHAALTAAVDEPVVLGAATCAFPVPALEQVIQRAFQLMYIGERHRGQVVVVHELVRADTPEAASTPRSPAG